jgi:hypothetical protein
MMENNLEIPEPEEVKQIGDDDEDGHDNDGDSDAMTIGITAVWLDNKFQMKGNFRC